MSIYAQIIYHVVFSTKNRERVLGKPRRDDLYRFIWGVVQKRQCHLYRIGGVEDHVHVLISLHPAVALSDLIDEIKTASASWIKGQQAFPSFSHWQEGCGAFTHALHDKERLIECIRTQEQHHVHVGFGEEFASLLEEAGLAINEHDDEWLDDDSEPGEFVE